MTSSTDRRNRPTVLVPSAITDAMGAKNGCGWPITWCANQNAIRAATDPWITIILPSLSRSTPWKWFTDKENTARQRKIGHCGE